MNNRLLFPAGTHHLNGTQALTLARIRIKGGFARADNQNRVLCALRDKLTSPAVVADIPELIRAFQGAILTDLSPEQLSQLACIGTKISSDNIVFANFPAEHFTLTRQYDPLFKKRVSVWDVDFEILRKYIRQFQAGTWPSSSQAVAQPQKNAKEEASFCP
jgi:anionic cell wall polymer biosynthesis LytR-Cps2A-Psr (LCP) family protein